MYRLIGWLISVATFPGILVHEYAHQLFCNMCRVPVFEVSYFNPFRNPMGYVLHGRPSNLSQQFWISVGPLIVNSVACLFTGLLFASPVVTGLLVAWPDTLVWWLPVSLGMHAFPSLGDAKSLWSHVDDDRTSGYLQKLLIGPVVLILMLGTILSTFWLDVAYGTLLGVVVPQQVIASVFGVTDDKPAPVAVFQPILLTTVVVPVTATPMPTVANTPTSASPTTAPIPKQLAGPTKPAQWPPQQATRPSAPQQAQRTNTNLISSGPLEGGLRIGTLEWVPFGYSLVDYARKLDVQMLFHSLQPSDNASLDSRLVVDGQEYHPTSVRIAEVDVTSNTFSSELEVGRTATLALERGMYVLVTATFDTPASCMTAGEQKDACMRGKKTLIRLPEYNVQGWIQLFSR